MNDRNRFLAWLVTNWLVADPNYIEINEKDHYKNYQAQKYEGIKYIFFLGGRFKTVKQTPINVITGIAIVLPGVIFWIFEAKWIWYSISPALTIVFSYIWLLTFMFYFRAATSDPGILPRNIHFPKDVTTIDTPAPDEYFNAISIPSFREGNGVTVKYCPTCHIWRPPRASHCGVCNSCIISHDHHCKYLNNCVGYRNYRYFLWFLLTACVSCTLVVVMSFLQIYHYRWEPTESINSFKDSIQVYPLGFFLAIYSLVALVYPLLLLLFHLFLTVQNLTTREYLNYVRSENEFVNVYDTGSWYKNMYINWVGKLNGTAMFPLREESQVGDIRLKKLPPLD